MRVGVVEDKQSNDLSYGKYTNWDTLGGWVLNSIYSFWGLWGCCGKKTIGIISGLRYLCRSEHFAGCNSVSIDIFW